MRTSPRTLPAVLLAVVLVGSATAAGAQEPPPGFTDGLPVGEELGDEPAEAGAGAAAAPTRYFGAGAFEAVRASVTATSRTCTISNNGLTAMVLAPVFKESAAEGDDTGPSPMTLSRYDEWSGVFPPPDTNANANYGLYAFENPNTAFHRAYWHPGIGIWQYDSAGLGAPLTTIEAMDTGIVSGYVAQEMSTRYCNSTATTAAGKRLAAWAPWGSPCNACETFYQEMISTAPDFANLEMVPGISSLGGVQRRNCSLAGVPGTMPCWYVDPSVGVIQGATWWATLQPDGGSPTAAPAPLSKPFYVIDRGTTEERHWFREDTGYSIDIAASRTIGKNARPRAGQAGSGLTWSSSSTLCDLTVGRGPCVPVAPPGIESARVSVSSSNRAYPLDADGDGMEDVFWYGVGTSADLLWMGNGAGSFSPQAISITGVYDDILAGDIDGDGDDDLVVYNRTTGRAYLVQSDGDGTFTNKVLPVPPGRRPFLLDTDGDDDVEIFWYGPGSVPDSQWNWNGVGFSPTSRAVAGTYTPLVGDFDGTGRDDILWYAPGAAADKLWLYSTGGVRYSPSTRPVAGSYLPAVGDFDGDGYSDIAWYAPGSAADIMWFGRSGGFSPGSLSITGSYIPIVAALDADGRDQLVLYAPGVPLDYRFTWTATRARSLSQLQLPGQHSAAVGRFSSGGADGVLWYQAGRTPDVVWYR